MKYKSITERKLNEFWFVRIRVFKRKKLNNEHYFYFDNEHSASFDFNEKNQMIKKEFKSGKIIIELKKIEQFIFGFYKVYDLKIKVYENKKSNSKK